MEVIDKKRLKALAHSLKPVVMIGQAGFTEAVLAEIELALNSHELIKVKIRAEKADRDMITEQICSSTRAGLVQKIGQITVLYRPNPDK